MATTTTKTLLDAASSSTTGRLQTQEQLQGCAIGIEITDTATVDIEVSFDNGSTWLQWYQVTANDVRIKQTLPTDVRANVSSYTSGNVSVWVERNMQAAG